MSKSIYEEALKHLNILNDFVIMWCDEIDLNYHDTYKNNYQKVKKAIELGKLYKELAFAWEERFNYTNGEQRIRDLEQQIKELENDI